MRPQDAGSAAWSVTAAAPGTIRTTGGGGLASIIPRLSRAIAYSRWNTYFTISVVEPVLVDKGVVARYGYTRVEEGIDWLNSFRGHMFNICLIWMDRTELLNDLVTQLTESVEYQRQVSARM